MGVLSCDKRGCTNIMCDTCVNGEYYICYDCKIDFKDWMKTQSPLYMDSREFIYDKFKEFMSIDKEYPDENIDIDEAIDDFFNE
ncbi:MAG: hypothetical protein PF487_08905 [Bacteroidales bacterium]|jgi:hypothetical protein|nr:hypothetical protein [Bacteroidales bacterium]